MTANSGITMEGKKHWNIEVIDQISRDIMRLACFSRGITKKLMVLQGTTKSHVFLRATMKKESIPREKVFVQSNEEVFLY
jgi:hypothetical protein